MSSSYPDSAGLPQGGPEASAPSLPLRPHLHGTHMFPMVNEIRSRPRWGACREKGVWRSETSLLGFAHCSTSYDTLNKVLGDTKGTTPDLSVTE